MSYGGYQPGGGGYPPPPGGQSPYGGFPPPQQYGGYSQPPMSPNYAGTGKRILAYLIDSFLSGLGAIPGIILIFMGVGLAASQADSRGQIPDSAGSAMAGLIFLGYAAVFVGVFAILIYNNVYLMGRDGASWGKKWMGLKVVEQTTGQPLGFGKAFLREFIKWVVGNVCFILLLWPLWDQNKQGLWDKVANSNVYGD